MTPVSQVHVGGSSCSGVVRSHSPTQTDQRVAVPPEVPQDMRSSIEDMEIGQLRAKREVREVQGVSLDADRRELQRLARDSAPSTISGTSKYKRATLRLTRLERC